MAEGRFGVGIIGLQPGASWAAAAHIPALRALPQDFEIVGVANSSRESAEAAAAECGLPRAYASVDELVASPEVDIVAVTVKVPHHLDLVTKALAAGKHVYCEWPLGNGLAEAERLEAMARDKGVLGVIGTQARMAPQFGQLRTLISDGYVGEVLSATLVGTGMVWGAAIDQRNAYVLDRANGATMLTIPLGHTLAAVRDVLGEIAEVSARFGNRRKSSLLVDTGEDIPMSAPDQIVVDALLQNGAPLAIHYRGGTPRGTGFLFEINGTKGDLQLTGPGGHSQLVSLAIAGAKDEEQAMQPIPTPGGSLAGWPEDAVSGNVARVYARMAADLRDGTHSAPDFEDAVKLHRVLAAIEEAAESGQRVSVR